jgi:ribonuclease BN (tRNA processing enzyme)
LSSLGPGLTLALVEASFLSGQEGHFQHLSAAQAGATAAGAQAERLLITHLGPGTDRARAETEAAAAFGGPVEVAEVGKQWEI